jgi:Thioredoxin
VSEAPRRGRPRIVGVAALALCLGAIGFAIVSISVGTGDTDQIEITGAQQVQSTLGGLQQDGPRLGSPAPVSVQVFNDMQCDPCSEWNREVILPLIRGPVRDGELELVFHHFPMTQSGFFLGAYGAVAAAKQDYEWQFIELFFANQEKAAEVGADQDFLNNIARGIINLNVEQWQRDIDEEDVERTLLDDEELAAGRFPAEPAVVVVGPNGSEELIQSPTLAQVEEAISRVR